MLLNGAPSSICQPLRKSGTDFLRKLRKIFQAVRKMCPRSSNMISIEASSDSRSLFDEMFVEISHRVRAITLKWQPYRSEVCNLSHSVASCYNESRKTALKKRPCDAGLWLVRPGHTSTHLFFKRYHYILDELTCQNKPIALCTAWNTHSPEIMELMVFKTTFKWGNLSTKVTSDHQCTNMSEKNCFPRFIASKVIILTLGD